MNVIRLIGDKYFTECFQISKLRPKVGGTKPIPDEIFLENNKKYFIHNSEFHALGCIENDKIISWIAIAFIENITRGKFWVITSLYTTKFTKYFTFNNEEIGLLIKASFELAESKKYYEYYYSVGERIASAYEKQIQKNKYIPIGRYDYIDLDIVPANSRPNVDLYWKIMGQETKPDNIIIKKRVLRETYR
jgi:hypothetical protein